MEKSDFIILDGTRHPRHQYPDLFVSIHRLGYDSEVEEAAKRLNLSLGNTAKEHDGTGYIGNINHEQALNINTAIGGFTLPLLYFADMLYQLIETIKRKRDTYNGNGNTIHPRILEDMFDEITEERIPWRGEHLDAEFGENTITYHKFVGGKFIKVTEKLEDCLMRDKAIDLKGWIGNPTSQGLPRKNCKAGGLNYWCPVEGRVARFVAGSGRADLDCDWNPQNSFAELGVRYSVSAEDAQKLQQNSK